MLILLGPNSNKLKPEWRERYFCSKYMVCISNLEFCCVCELSVMRAITCKTSKIMITYKSLEALSIECTHLERRLERSDINKKLGNNVERAKLDIQAYVERLCPTAKRKAKKAADTAI